MFDTGVMWGGFLLLVLTILAFDLGVFSRERRSITAGQALFRTAVYASLAMLFAVFVYFAYENHWFDMGRVGETNSSTEPDDPTHRQLPTNGREAAAQFVMGYLLEQALSIDNIFVIALILTYFQVPAAYQHRVLLWGILGALVMRGVMIGIGAVLVKQFAWVNYVFGVLLIYTAFKMLFADEGEVDFDSNRLVKIVRRFFRVHPGYDGDKFFTRMDGVLAVTPLFLALVIVETTDLIFAVDSIPAIFGVTHDAFIVFTSNVFAILGLRSLYFALSDLLGRFRFLKYSLVAVLGFVGLKMLAHHNLPHYIEEIELWISFGFIMLSLGVGVGLSWVIPESKEEAAKHVQEDQPT